MATMTVKDLIEKLSHIDEDAKVCVPDRNGFLTGAEEVRTIDTPYYLREQDDRSDQAVSISWVSPKIP